MVGGAALACQSSFGQASENELYMGFQNQAGSGASDYIINLGSASSFVGQSSVINLSSDFSLSDFDAVLGGSTFMYGGVIGADNGEGGVYPNIYVTQLRSGGPGDSSVAGSIVTQQDGQVAEDTTFSDLGNLYSPAAGTGGLDASKSWESLVDPANDTGSFQSNTGLNPDSQIGTSSVLYEDLWENSDSSSRGTTGFTYLGYFTMDFTGSSPDVTFTPVPEPTAYSIFAGAGLLLLALRRRMAGRNS